MSHEATFRQDLIDALERELVGPDLPPYGTEVSEGQTYAEILEESPLQRYSAGVLFPQSQPIDEVDDMSESDGEDDPTENDPPLQLDSQALDIDRSGHMNDQLADAYDETIRMANEYFPSAIGLTFLTEHPGEGLIISPRAAIYESQTSPNSKSKFRQWLRKELTIEPVTLTFPADGGHGIREFNLTPHLRLRALYHRRSDGSFLLTISMLNSHTSHSSKPPSGAHCFFQVGFDVRDPQDRYIFREYRVAKRVWNGNSDESDQREEAALELLYRNRRAYAAGHGCAPDWGREHSVHTNLVKTSTLPRFKVPPVEPRSEGGDELSMYHLSGADDAFPPEQVPSLLEKVASDYETWIADRNAEVSGLPNELQAPAVENLSACNECLSRMRSGIEVLRRNDVLLTAFRLANRAMLMQQYHSRRNTRTIDSKWEDFPEDYKPKDAATGRWRTFQLAFILMNLTSIAPHEDGTEHDDRELVDLIWFPTGGGKTEAYLGLAACDIFYRRLTRPSNAGCTVLMRYTLRLLTSQQFQRASSMICACELIRRENPEILGEEPITIGLWVGESLTPIRRNRALKALNDLADEGEAENPFQLLKCPWCGTVLDDRTTLLGYAAYKFVGQTKTVIFICPERRCPFSTRKKRRHESHHLPVLVVDEDIYASPPTLIIGTVDKFAMMAWREEARRIFNLGIDDYDPPDLIIQDELHLISGPLGSVVGLYESAIDLFCSSGGRKPKIVSSTATIRRAWHQCQALYDRPIFQFPPQGLDISDSYFAKENTEADGRVYVGVFATAAPSFVTAMVRTLSALFQSCNTIPLPSGTPESTRDPYWTVLQYFNSLRELGHAATLVEADIPEYMWAIASRSHLPKELCRNLGSPVELTSRRTADEIPEILERLTVRYPRTNEESPRPLDTLLATNMISVGVDVERLGLMVIAGQPKTTSEYIQASSRVGRSKSAPGLIVTMYNPGKPRDRSHYEHFRPYHEAFYKHVEPTSVTPFSLPVLERALHAVLVILVRHLVGLQTPDLLNPNEAQISQICDFIKQRCRNVDSEHEGVFLHKLRKLLDEWNSIRPREWGRLGPPPPGRPLLYPAGSEPLDEWGDSPWPTPTSMRNVDVECDAQVVPMYEVTEDQEEANG